MLKLGVAHSTIIATMVFGGSPCLAQAAPQAVAADGAVSQADTGMSDIVVTAQRRSEPLQRVPISVSALSGEMLASRNIVNVQDFSAIAPNVSFGELNGFARINIRGIGNQNYFTGGDPSVTMYVDGAVISQAAAQMSAFFDLERVEVLRGPQGTLYGRNATGGSVNLITRKPTDTFTGYVNLGLGNYDQVQAEGAVSGPIGGGLKARLSVLKQRRDGFGTNLFDGRDVDDANRLYARAQIEFESGIHDFLLTAQYGRERDANYQVHVFGGANPGRAGAPTGVLLGGTLASDPRDMNSEAPLRNRRKTYSVTGDYTAKLADGFTARSITNYRSYKQDFISDVDGTEKRYAAVQQIIDSRQFSEEVQLNYDSSRSNAVGGLYYFHEQLDGNNNLGAPGGPTVAPPQGGPPGAFVTSLIGDLRVRAYGVFAQGTFKLLPTVGLTGGLRYSDETRHGEGTTRAPTASIPPVFTVRRISNDDLSYKVGVDWNVTPAVLAYGSFSTGFKSGVIIVASADPAAAPEKVKAWEIGLKSDFLDRRLRVNLAAFWYDYRDLQLAQLLPGAVTATITNAASARNKGIEAEITARPFDRLTIDAKIGYLDATFRNFQSRDPRVAPPAVSPLLNLSGNTLPYAPKWSGDIHGDFRIPLGALEDKVRLTVGADAIFTSRVEFSAFNQPDLAQGGNTKYDVSLRLESYDRRWSLTGWVKNLTNEDTYANRTVGGSTSTNRAIYGVLTPPRTFGATAGVNF